MSLRAVSARRRLALAFVLAAASGAGAAEAPEEDSAAAGMAGLDGPYAMTREGSGTSWQPDSTPMSGLHFDHGPWMSMVHGMAAVVYDEQGGPRGQTQSFSSGMLMLMARRELADGALGVRLMASSDPFMGPRGYPLLFQSGESADGHAPLIDRQHPHDLLMEAAVSYSYQLARDSALFLYAALPGAPALGPNAFMHRLSGTDNPEAPLSHHWLDSTHISWGVLTGGWSGRQLRLEASAFNGREPDQDRYNVELRALDSYALRVAYNPTAALSLQGSFGRLASPEQLQPQVSVRRTTASVSYNAPLARWWQTTLAWGRNDPSAGHASNAFLLESALNFAGVHTFFGRLERVGKDELFVPGTALAGTEFTINKLSLGYLREVAHIGALDLGLGGLLSAYDYPATLNGAYGSHPRSFMVFMRARL